MQRIYSAVFGSGLGHTTRVHEIAKKLERENQCDFLYSSFDEGYDFLKSYGENVTRCPRIDVMWNVAGGFSGRSTILKSPYILVSFLDQVTFERKRISKYNPRAVLSDSRLSAVVAGKSRSYPVVTILNQIRILFPPRFRTGAYSEFLERIGADFLGLFWSLSDEILVPDLPPPFTISEANVSQIDVGNKVCFTGFMTPKLSVDEGSLSRVRNLLGFDSRPIVFMQISGPNPTKHAFVQPALNSAEILSRRFNVVISKGFPTGSSEPARLSNGTLVYDWCPIKNELFLMSDVLVTRGGHTTLSQCISAGKPTVVVPIFNHSEQIWNAEKFAKLGVGVEIKSESLSSSNLAVAVQNCIDDSSYLESMQKLKQISDKFDGISTASNIMKGFL